MLHKAQVVGNLNCHEISLLQTDCTFALGRLWSEIGSLKYVLNASQLCSHLYFKLASSGLITQIIRSEQAHAAVVLEDCFVFSVLVSYWLIPTGIHISSQSSDSAGSPSPATTPNQDSQPASASSSSSPGSYDGLRYRAGIPQNNPQSAPGVPQW